MAVYVHRYSVPFAGVLLLALCGRLCGTWLASPGGMSVGVGCQLMLCVANCWMTVGGVRCW